jgi:hypothetical protein
MWENTVLDRYFHLRHLPLLYCVCVHTLLPLGLKPIHLTSLHQARVRHMGAFLTEPLLTNFWRQEVPPKQLLQYNRVSVYCIYNIHIYL